MSKKNDWLEERQAFAEGKAIQYSLSGRWKDIKAPNFDDNKNYRIKPVKESVPFDFSDAKNIIGKAVIHIEDGTFHIITDVFTDNVIVRNGRTQYSKLFTDYKFTDGNPCGKVVE